MLKHDPSLIDFVQKNGYGIVDRVLTGQQIAPLVSAADIAFAQHGRPSAGLRAALGLSSEFAAAEEQLRPIARRIIGDTAFPVRSILFDKTADANWDVIWHQDVTIAVNEKRDVAGFGPWSMKNGWPHVQPPARVLQEMITLRLALDDCDASNGPLLVVPGSQNNGMVDVRVLNTTECDQRAVPCHVQAGDVVIMRPLTLHASRKSLHPKHRRVLHIEYASAALPEGLEWATSA